jgi:probable O-glycosylation ligase (exosortase A-associated)
MGTVALFMLLLIAALVSLFKPWMGLLSTYLIAILNPQSIWYWLFNDFRPVYAILLPTLVGIFWRFISSRASLSGLGNSSTAWALLLGFSCILSWVFAPFSASISSVAVQNSAFIAENQTKIIISFLLAPILIYTPKHLLVLSLIIVASSLYLVFWANNEYLTKLFTGRLPGPTNPDGAGTYSDENNFAAFFVATMPFLWYFGLMTKRWYLRLPLWATIPLLWHAIFLTGSRGGLLGVSAGMLLIILRSKRPTFAFSLLIPVFLAAIFWQGGETMLNRASSITEYDSDRSASRRLDAWIVAIKMMATYPLTGVGPGAFVRAFANFDPDTPLQAHNTFFQIGGEYGIAGFIAIIGLVASCLFRSVRSAKLIREGNLDRKLVLINESVLGGLAGLLVCACFLTLQLFEILYLLLAMSCCIAYCIRLQTHAATQGKTAEPPSLAGITARRY